MEKDIKVLNQRIKDGSCCASALVEMGLFWNDEENPQMVKAVSGLCGGVRSRMLCGALTGAACMLNIVDPDRANSEMVPELTAWFREKYGTEFGGTDCGQIIGANGEHCYRCPRIIEESYVKAKEILVDFGHSTEAAVWNKDE